MNETAPTSRPTDWLDDASARFSSDLPHQFERIGWPEDVLRPHRSRLLRELLGVAADRSPFHAERLHGIDPLTFDLEDLSTLPVLTKTEMMARFDEVVTDPRLTKRLVESHLAGQDSTPTLLLNEYVPLASGGSSGERCMFVYDRQALAAMMAAVVRDGLARIAANTGWPPPTGIPITVVAAPSAIHATGAAIHLARSFAHLTLAPATLPFDEIVQRVGRSAPQLLVGYTSVIARLADERAAGRLDIAPDMVIVTSEQLTPDLAGRIAAGFGAPPVNSFGSSEGLMGSARPGSDEFTFASDATILEFVDADDQPVEVGERAHHVLVTALLNHTQPLIRYRLDDVMVPLPPASDHGHQRARVEGRTDDEFRIGGASIHPLVVRTVALSHPSISEYQTFVDDDNVALTVVASGPLELDEVGRDLRARLEAAGATPSTVDVRVVDHVDRDPRTGKARRFVMA